jgi:hypothetical protein
MPSNSLTAAINVVVVYSAGLGQMAETIGRDPLYQGKPGFEGMLNDVRVLLERRRDLEYYLTRPTLDSELQLFQRSSVMLDTKPSCLVSSAFSRCSRRDANLDSFHSRREMASWSP